jgi:hypothetical protein
VLGRTLKEELKETLANEGVLRMSRTALLGLIGRGLRCVALPGLFLFWTLKGK